MRAETAANILGALAQALADEVDGAIAAGAERSQLDAAALVHLSKYAGSSIEALRVPLRLSHPGCVRAVDRLEEQGLLERREAADRRARALELTGAGRAAARAALRERQGRLCEALRSLSAAERETLAELAGKVLTRLVRDEAHALAICRVCDYGACPDAVCPVARAFD